MAGDPPIFLHLTKTAGGTLKQGLAKAEGLNAYFIYGRPNVEAFAAERPADVDLIYGHSVFGVHEQLGLEPRYGCFMRHPVTRTVSHYWHLFNVDQSQVGAKIRESQDIDDFFAHKHHWEFSDFMCRIISGVGPKEIDGEELYERSRENIDRHFFFVGFQEFLGESIHKMESLLNAKIVLDQDVNVGRYSRSKTSEATLDKIRSMNEQDLRLFKYCLGKFL